MPTDLDLQKTFERVQKRAEHLDRLCALFRELPSETWKDLVFEAIMRVEGERSDAAHKPTVAGNPDAPVGKYELVVRVLREMPGLDLREVAAKVYPEVDTEVGYKRVRSAVKQLASTNRVRSFGGPRSGKWRATDEG